MNPKLTNDIYSQFSDLSKTIKKLKQDIKKPFTEQRITIIHEVLDLINKSSFQMLTVQHLKLKSSPSESDMILNEIEIFKILDGLDQNEINITNNMIQLLCDKGLFNFFTNKDEVFANYLIFSEAYSLEKYGKTIPTSDD